MVTTLVEKYQNRLTRANNEYRARTGRPLTESKKMLTAQVLENAAQFMNYKMKLHEALDNSVGVQTADIGAYKRFCLDITEATLPNLIAPELCMTISMDHQVGSVMYRKYTAGSRKAVRNSDGTFDRFNQDPSLPLGPNQDVIRGTFANGKPQSEYTSRVVEISKTLANADNVVLRWTPVVRGSILIDDGTNWIHDEGTNVDGTGKFVSYAKASVDLETMRDPVTGTVVYKFFNAGTTTPATGSTVSTTSVKYGTSRDDAYDASQVVDAPKVHGQITSLAAGTYKISYQYENEYVPKNFLGQFDTLLAA